MTSVVFTAPRHLQSEQVMEFAPGVLFVSNKLRQLEKGEYVYVCHRNRILYRVKYKETPWLDDKHTVDGEHRGPGWALKIDAPELPPWDIAWQCGRLKYLRQGELW